MVNKSKKNIVTTKNLSQPEYKKPQKAALY